MTLKFDLLSLLLIIFSLTTAQAQRHQVKDFHWILGTWELKSQTGSLYETWWELNDSTLVATSFKVKPNRDTLVLERIRVSCDKKGCYYIPIATGQNNGQSVVFTMSSIMSSGFVADNPKHDFPKRISYAVSGDQLDAVISGDGREKKYSFVRYR